MNIKENINKFWYGNIKLWKSFWVIGILHALSITYLIPIIEKNIFNNDEILIFLQIQDYQIPVLDITKVHFISKIIILISTIFITVGIWRSAEKYRGNIVIIFLTLIYLSFNNILPTIKFILLIFLI